jgi:hypothetical protein
MILIYYSKLKNMNLFYYLSGLYGLFPLIIFISQFCIDVTKIESINGPTHGDLKRRKNIQKYKQILYFSIGCYFLIVIEGLCRYMLG